MYQKEIRPVSTEENKSVRGNALVGEALFQSELERTLELRRQNAAYLASLPTDPLQAIARLREILAPQNAEGGYPADFLETKHKARALESLLQDVELGELALDEAVKSFAMEICLSLCSLQDVLDSASDLLFSVDMRGVGQESDGKEPSHGVNVSRQGALGDVSKVSLESAIGSGGKPRKAATSRQKEPSDLPTPTDAQVEILIDIARLAMGARVIIFKDVDEEDSLKPGVNGLIAILNAIEAHANTLAGSDLF